MKIQIEISDNIVIEQTEQEVQKLIKKEVKDILISEIDNAIYKALPKENIETRARDAVERQFCLFVEKEIRDHVTKNHYRAYQNQGYTKALDDCVKECLNKLAYDATKEELLTHVAEVLARKYKYGTSGNSALAREIIRLCGNEVD